MNGTWCTVLAWETQDKPRRSLPIPRPKAQERRSSVTPGTPRLALTLATNSVAAVLAKSACPAVGCAAIAIICRRDMGQVVLRTTVRKGRCGDVARLRSKRSQGSGTGAHPPLPSSLSELAAAPAAPRKAGDTAMGMHPGWFPLALIALRRARTLDRQCR